MQLNDPLLYGTTLPYKDFTWQQPFMGSTVAPWQSAPRMLPPFGMQPIQQQWAPFTPHMQQFPQHLQQPWTPYPQQQLPTYLPQQYPPYLQQQYPPYLQQPITPYLHQATLPFVQPWTQPVAQPFFNWQRPFVS